MSFPVGTRVGPYDIVTQLGAGGMGEVYRAHELRAARGYASFLVGVGRAPDTRDVLQICDWFTEGRSTPDFVYAEGLLRTL